MRARDRVAVAALRSALAAIDNAETVSTERRGPLAVEHASFAGTVGPGAAEAERRSLTEAQVEAIVRGEVADRRAAALGYERSGRPEHAARLRDEAQVLAAYLDAPPPA